MALSATATAGTAVVLLTVLFGVLLDRRLSSEADHVVQSRAESGLAGVEVQAGRVELTGGEVFLDAGIWVFEDLSAKRRLAIARWWSTRR